MKRTELHNRRKTPRNWLIAIVIGLVAVIIVPIMVFQFHTTNPKNVVNSSESTSLSTPSTSTTSMENSSTEQTSSAQDYLYAVDVKSVAGNTETYFRPKGTDVGSLNVGRVVTIIPEGAGYNIRLEHNYNTATHADSVHNTALYTAKIENIPTTIIHVWGYGNTPHRDVKVNTRITLEKRLTDNEDGFIGVEGEYLYLFYASDGTVSLAVSDTDGLGNRDKFMEYQLNGTPS